MAIAQPINPMTSRLTVKSLLLWGLQALGALAWLAQLVIDGSEANLVSATLVLASSSLLLQYLRVSSAMTTNPLSSFALLGFTCSSQLISLIAQSVDGSPFIQYLRAPTFTFSVLACVHVAAVITHFTYRNFQPFTSASASIAKNIYSPLQIHKIPQPISIWIFALVGLIATVYGGGASGDVSGKFLAGYVFFMWAPFLIPLYISIVGEQYCNAKQQYTLLTFYLALIIVIALIKNFRAMLFAAPIQITFLFLMHYCRGLQPVSPKLIRGIAATFVAATLFMPALSDLVTAMEIARANRDKATPMEMMQQTGEAFLDKTRLQSYREEGALSLLLKQYDEKYLSNPLLSRFTETKFHDNMLYFGSMFSEYEREQVIRNQIDKIVAIAPQNILDFLDIKFQKDQYHYSSGDFYLSLNHGGSLGGYATGSIWADLYVIFGPWFPFIVFLLLTPIFILTDALSRFEKDMYISPAAMCAMWPLFLYGIGGESISAKINQITRGSIQQVILYALLAFIVTIILSFLKRRAFVHSDDVTPTDTSSPAPRPP